MLRHGLALIASLCLLPACDRITGTQATTDYYRETVGGRELIGAVAVRLVTEGKKTAINFAPAAKDWKDPRPNGRGPANPPMVSAGCTLLATRTDKKSASIDAGQTCTHEGRTLTFERGSVWVTPDDTIGIDLTGKVDGKEYGLTFPMLIAGDALKLTEE
jgi:hypothetical protein